MGALFCAPCATPPMLLARLGHVVTDGRVVGMTVEDDLEEDEGQKGSNFLSMLDPEVRPGSSMADSCESDSTRCQLSVIALRHPI